MRVAIQGIEGSFHDIAAHQYFSGENVNLVCCNTFEEVFNSINTDVDTVGLVAIENTIAGSLLHNYELLRDSGTSIVGEYKLHIQHCICCLSDDDWSTLSEVHSHPVALMQCRHFLASHASSLKAVEADDTAGSARSIAENHSHGWAAICHADAARYYGLRVLQDSIEDNKHNFTRFLVVAHGSMAERMRDQREVNKASIVFTLPDEEGSLSKVLTILSFYGINLTKIQSLPIIGREWEYMFYVDVTYDDLTRYRQSIVAITPLVRNIRELGEYRKA